MLATEEGMKYKQIKSHFSSQVTNSEEETKSVTLEAVYSHGRDIIEEMVIASRDQSGNRGDFLQIMSFWILLYPFALDDA